MEGGRQIDTTYTRKKRKKKKQGKLMLMFESCVTNTNEVAVS